MLRIAFLTAFDPLNRRSGSGSFYYMARALQRYCGEVSCLGPINVKERLFGKILNQGTLLLLRKRFPYYMSFLVARRYAYLAAQRMKDRPYDVIVAPFGTVGTAFLETNIPLVLIEDATFALLHNYYPHYSNLLNNSILEAHAITSQAFRRAALLIFSSTWAAQSAIEDYGIDQEKVHVIPFGANIEQVPDWQAVLEKRQSQRCRLLFVGVDWWRKGGDIAFETLLSLEKLGIEAELTICGCSPPLSVRHKHMHVIAYLDRNDAEQRKDLEQLYARSDFLLLPTRGDCTPFVFCEANAFGLPVITTDTGGVIDVIQDGENGFVLPYNARGNVYAEVIAHAYQDDQLYMKLHRKSRAVFDSHLNWDAWGISMQSLLAQYIAPQITDPLEETEEDTLFSWETWFGETARVREDEENISPSDESL